MQLVLAIEKRSEIAADLFLEFRRAHTVYLHLTGANHPGGATDAVFYDVLAEKHEAGLEYHAKEIEKGSPNERKLDCCHAVFAFDEVTDQTFALRLWVFLAPQHEHDSRPTWAWRGWFFSPPPMTPQSHG